MIIIEGDVALVGPQSALKVEMDRLHGPVRLAVSITAIFRTHRMLLSETFLQDHRMMAVYSAPHGSPDG